MPTVIATPGASDANSYLTVAEANAYHASRLFNDVWLNADDATKETALIWATRVLDREEWKGYRTEEIQALRWPRTSVYDRDGYYIADNVVPKFLKDATAELAFLLATADRSAETGTEGFKKIKVGPIEIELDSTDRVETISKEVYQMIHGYTMRGSVKLVRG